MKGKERTSWMFSAYKLISSSTPYLQVENSIDQIVLLNLWSVFLLELFEGGGRVQAIALAGTSSTRTTSSLDGVDLEGCEHSRGANT